jgi:hypothetical protein
MNDNDHVEQSKQDESNNSNFKNQNESEDLLKCFIGIEKPFIENPRKFDRRTLKDRRRPCAKSNYKGPERRYHNRRSGVDRRGDSGLQDNLACYFPSIPDDSRLK